MLLICNQAFCQQPHFIYLQTENREPFYVLLNKKNYSSSSIGYVIVPKLENGEYSIRIGFPKNTGPEQDYILQVRDNEQGYLIKEFGEKGWALFNLQSLMLQYAGEARKQKEGLAATKASEAKKEADAITAEAKRKIDLLSESEIVKSADSIAAITPLPAVKKITDSATLAKNISLEKPDTGIKIISIEKSNAVVANTINPAPVLIAQTKTDSGFIYKYAVLNAEGRDTVNAFIIGATAININQVNENKQKEPVTKQNPAQADTVKFLNMDFKQDSTKQDTDSIKPVFNKPNTSVENRTAENKKLADSATSISERETVVIPKWDNNVRMDSVVNKVSTSALPNSNCKAQADDKDFFSLRRRMAAEEGTDEMVLVAKKVMKEKCFTTLQVRNLSMLFLTDADRYQFLDAAYAFTFDAYQYDSLSDLLKDNYYVQRFKALIRN